MAKAKKSYFEEFFRFSPKWEFFWKNLVSSVLTLKTFFLHVRFQKNPVGRFWEKLLTDLLTYLHKGTMKILCYKTVHLFYLHVCENNQKPEGNAFLKVCILCVPIFYFLPKVNTSKILKYAAYFILKALFVLEIFCNFCKLFPVLSTVSRIKGSDETGIIMTS